MREPQRSASFRLSLTQSYLRLRLAGQVSQVRGAADADAVVDRVVLPFLADDDERNLVSFAPAAFAEAAEAAIGQTLCWLNMTVREND